jgi:hypothetical protein
MLNEVQTHCDRLQEYHDKQVNEVETNGYNPSFAMEGLLRYLQINDWRTAAKLRLVKDFEKTLIVAFANKYQIDLTDKIYCDVLTEKNRFDIY